MDVMRERTERGEKRRRRRGNKRDLFLRVSTNERWLSGV